MADKILLCLCKATGHEMDFIREAFEQNWIAPLGPNVNGFESDLENFLNVVDTTAGEEKLHKRVVALGSGTSAIHLGLAQCGVKAGDEVMVQSFTFSASVNPIVYQGAMPVFVDSDPQTWNMDPELLDKAIADRVAKTGKKPKAIVPVYLYGMPAKMDEIMKVSRKWDIPVMEDAAEGLGSRYAGRCMGTFGKFGALSFNGNKMITTSGGGALVCGSDEAWKKTMFLATQAREPYAFYQHEEIGYNYRMSNICAGVGRGQMYGLEQHIAHHRHVEALYEELLADVEGVEMHTNPKGAYPGQFDSNFWLCALTLAPGVKIKGAEEAYPEDFPKGIERPDDNIEALRKILDAAGVESRPLWKPMHLQPVFRSCPAYLNGVSEDLFSRGLCLPAGPWVSDGDVRHIVNTIKASIVK